MKKTKIVKKKPIFDHSVTAIEVKKPDIVKNNSVTAIRCAV